MGRPIENNADYFSHDTDMRNDLRIKAVRTRYGLTGYAVYNMMLEVLTDQQFFCLEYDDIMAELLAGDFGLEAEQLKEILAFMIRIGLFQMEGEGQKKIQCARLEERMQGLMAKRIRWKRLKEVRNKDTKEEENEGGDELKEVFRAEKENNSTLNGVFHMENPADSEFSSWKTPQSKVKESKEKKSKEKERKADESKANDKDSSRTAAAAEVSSSEEIETDKGEDEIGKLFIRTFSRSPNFADRAKTENLMKEYGKEKTEKAFFTAREKLGEKINLAYITGILINEANGITKDNRRKYDEQKSGNMGGGNWKDRRETESASARELRKWQEYIERTEKEHQNKRNTAPVPA